jgi:hydrogenase/urease accessory protein HupE
MDEKAASKLAYGIGLIMLGISVYHIFFAKNYPWATAMVFLGLVNIYMGYKYGKEENQENKD